MTMFLCCEIYVKLHISLLTSIFASNLKLIVKWLPSWRLKIPFRLSSLPNIIFRIFGNHFNWGFFLHSGVWELLTNRDSGKVEIQNKNRKLPCADSSNLLANMERKCFPSKLLDFLWMGIDIEFKCLSNACPPLPHSPPLLACMFSL